MILLPRAVRVYFATQPTPGKEGSCSTASAHRSRAPLLGFGDAAVVVGARGPALRPRHCNRPAGELSAQTPT